MRDASPAIDAVTSEPQRRLLEAIADCAVVLLEADGTIESWSPAAERMTGYPAAEAIGRSLAMLVPDGAEAVRHLQAARERGRSDADGWRVRRDGSRFWASAVLTRLVDDGGELRGFVEVIRDGSAGKRAEDVHRREATRLRGILASAMDAIVSVDESQRIILFNPAAQRTFGYTTSEILGKPLDWLVPERLREIHAEHVRRFLASGATSRTMGEPGRVLGRRADGSEFPLEATISKVETDGETVLTAILRDVSRRRANEDQIRLLWHAVEQSPASIIMTDPEARIVYVNRRFTEVTGYEREEVLGGNPRILNSGAHPPELYRELWQTLLAGGEWHGEFQNRRKDGTVFWERAHLSPVTDDSGRVLRYIAIKEDITAWKGLEAQQRQSQKMEAIGRLAGGVAHDFNNVLTAIHGFAQLLRSETDPAEAVEYIDAIESGAERAALLTRKLLAFSRQQDAQPRPLDLNGTLRAMRPMLQRVLGSHIRIECRLAAEPMAIRADPVQLEQVVMNLAINARDAMPDGGELVFETAAVGLPEADPLLAAGALAPGRYVVLRVSDTGHGMDAETRNRAFEPFFTTKPPGEGSGLGLPTVYGIVHQTGGAISIDSEPGRGATFTIHLPAVAEPAGGPPRAATHRPGHGPSILLVEDEEPVRRLAVRILEGAGYHVLQAADGTEAVRVAEALEAPVELLVTDMMMPNLGGAGLSEQLSGRWPKLRVLFMSGYSAEAVEQYGVLRAGAPLLEKPFSPDELLDAVAAMLAGGSEPG